MTTGALLEVAVILMATALAAIAIAPWLVAVFPMEPDDGSDRRLDHCLEAITRPLLRSRGPPS